MKRPFVREKPARFPAWQRRLDPTLAAEDANRLYNMFRIRRRDGPWSGLRTIVESLGVLVGILAAMIAVALVYRYVTPLVALMVFFVGLAAPAAWLLAGNLRSRRSALPRRLWSVFSIRGYEPEGAEQIWLAGATGREIIEAIYLEKREGDTSFYGFLSVLIAALGAGWLASHPKWWPSLGMLIPAMLFLLYHLALFLYMWQGLMTKTQKLDRLVSIWRGERRFLRALDRRFWALVAIVPGIWFLQLSYYMLLWLVMCFNHGGLLSQWSIGSADDASRALAAALLMAVCAVILWFIRRALGEAIAVGMEDTLKRADHAFDRFMAGSAQLDVDGYRWADWRHRGTGATRGNAMPNEDLRLGIGGASARTLPPSRRGAGEAGDHAIRLP